MPTILSILCFFFRIEHWNIGGGRAFASVSAARQFRYKAVCLTLTLAFPFQLGSLSMSMLMIENVKRDAAACILRWIQKTMKLS